MPGHDPVDDDPTPTIMPYAEGVTFHSPGSRRGRTPWVGVTPRPIEPRGGFTKGGYETPLGYALTFCFDTQGVLRDPGLWNETASR